MHTSRLSAGQATWQQHMVVAQSVSFMLYRAWTVALSLLCICLTATSILKTTTVRCAMICLPVQQAETRVMACAGARFVPKPEERLLSVVHALLHRCYKLPYAQTADIPDSLRGELTGAAFSLGTH